MSLPLGYLKRVLAGALFGLYMAHLLYYLNPQIEITPGRLLLVTVLYGVICGLLFGTILWGFRLLRLRSFGRPDLAEHRRQGFGLIVAAAFVSAAVYFVHLAAFRIYLPPGAVRILSKATYAITATAILLFLLWLAERRARTNVSRVIVALACLLIATSSVFLYQRRERYRAQTQAVVVADVGTLAGSRPLIFVSIRNLPYDWIVTLAGEGALPSFERTIAEGYFGRIEPFTSRTTKELWASLATGQLPNRTGVTGGYSYETPLNAPDERFLILPSGVGFRVWGLIPPVRRYSAELPAGQSLPFWEMFERLGIDTEVVNWPGMPPLAGGEAIRPMSEAVAQRLGAAGERERILQALAGDLAAAEVAQRALQDGTPAVVVALNGLSTSQPLLGIGSNTLPQSASREGVVIRAYLEQLDAVIGELRKAAPEALVLVVSTSGPDPVPFPGSPLGIVRWLIEQRDPGADDGFILMRGDGVRPNTARVPARITDVVPTLLFAAGLPVARDLDGRVLTEAFDERFLSEHALSIIQTYQAEQILVRRTGS
jgi:hypothetical protein